MLAGLLPLLLLLFSSYPPVPAVVAAPTRNLRFHEAPQFYNSPGCPPPLHPGSSNSDICPASALVHVAMTLDADYLRGTIAAVHSILRHAACPQSIHFHFIAAVESHPDASSSTTNIASLTSAVASAFPAFSFAIHPFAPSSISHLISPALRSALDRPLNYARIHLPNILPASCSPLRFVYLDSDVLLVDDIHNLVSTPFPSPDTVIAAPEHCKADLSVYFTEAFWSNPLLANTFSTRPRKPCYFNTGVMVLDLAKWRAGGYTDRLENWMRIQRRNRIYELGSLPPFLLEFAGRVAPVGQRWNQHGLGGIIRKDRVDGSIRDRSACCIGAGKGSRGSGSTSGGRARLMRSGRLTTSSSGTRTPHLSPVMRMLRKSPHHYWVCKFFCTEEGIHCRL